MHINDSQSSLARRLFLARLGIGAGVVGATFTGSTAAMAQVGTDAPWRPVRHTQDDWLETIPGKHRFLFDTNTADGMALALQFAQNYLFASRTSYGLQNSDSAIVVVARHKSTTFGYNDAMWAKYGKQLSEYSTFTDSTTKQPPKVNVYATAGNGTEQPAGRMNALIKAGAHIAVCQVSTQTIAFNIARATGSDANKIVEEINANLVGNAHAVPAGIVTVNRAQERGYSFVYAV